MKIRLLFLSISLFAMTHSVSGEGYVQTVQGPIASTDLGRTLPHEHVLVDFIGAGQVSPDRYDRNEAFATILPYLEEIRTQGVRSFIECTPAYLGRDPVLLRRLSETTGLHILTNTGYYAAVGEKFLPPHVYEESAEELAARWIEEWEEGIDGTGIRPGFIKIATNNGPLTAVDAKIVRAAALTHRQTGLIIGMHTGVGGDGSARARAAADALAILTAEGVRPDAWIWTHAQAAAEESWVLLIEAAKRGAWISFDGLRSTDNTERHVDYILRFAEEDLLDRVLVSHDAGWYRVGEPGGGKFVGYTHLFSVVIPQLREYGLSEEQIEMITVSNPARAYSIKKRLVDMGR